MKEACLRDPFGENFVRIEIESWIPLPKNRALAGGLFDEDVRELALAVGNLNKMSLDALVRKPFSVRASGNIVAHLPNVPCA